MFATVFVKGVEHPDVRRALVTPFEPGLHPEKVAVPIEDLLGPDGYQHCSGYRLEPVGGSMDAARDCRSAWVHALCTGREPDVPKPRCSSIESFQGGIVEFFFRPNRSKDGYEVATMYVEPPNDDAREL